jgi:hypothetical protein
MISKRFKAYLVAAAVLSAAVIPGSVLSGSAAASTSVCGGDCTSPSVESLGTGEVLTVSGSNVEMATANTTSTTQDWTPVFEGDVTNAAEAGVVSSKLEMNYGGDTLVEFQYVPGGVPSDSCLADTANAGVDDTYFYAQLSVGLATCGTTSQSLWILDAANEGDGYVDLINAGYEAWYTYEAPNNSSADSYTSLFAEPEVLTVSGSKVELAPLSELGGVVSSSQLWAAWSAPAQSEAVKAIQAEKRKASAARFG